MTGRTGRLRPRSLKARLIVSVLCLAAVGLAAFGAVGTVLLRHSLVDEIDHRLSGFARADDRPPAPEAPEGPEGQEGQEAPEAPEAPGAPPPLPTDLRLLVADDDGSVVSSVGQTERDPGVPDLGALGTEPLADRAGEPFELPDSAGGSDWRVLVAERDDGNWSVAAQSLEGVDSTLNQLILIESVLGAAVLAALAAGTVAAVRSQLRPLQRIEETAQHIAGGDFGRRVPEGETASETGRLAGALNTMLEELSRALGERDRSVETTRRFIADASHELRTPLSSIRGFAELYRRGRSQGVVAEDPTTERWMSRVEEEALKMGRMVDDLLVLSRFDEEPALERSDFDLGALAGEAVGSARARCPDRQIALHAEELHIAGDRGRLGQVLENLIGNALAHTPGGTPVEVRVERTAPPPDPGAAHTGRLPGGVREAAVVSVADQGPGIPPDELPHVFDRFYRAEGTGARPGAGLGLPISAAFTLAHDGMLSVESDAGGSVFSVVLPLR